MVLLLFPGVQQLIVSSLQFTDQTSVGRRDFIGRTILHQIHDLIFQKFLFSFVCRSQTCVGVEGKQDFVVNDRNRVRTVNADRFHRFCILEQISKPGALQSILLFGRRLHVLQIKCCQQSGLELALCAAFNKQGGDVLFFEIVAECRFPSGIREDGREDFILFPNGVVFREQGEQLAQRGGSRQKESRRFATA